MSPIGFDQSALDHYDIEAATHPDAPGQTQTDGWKLDAVEPKNERRTSSSLAQYSGTYHSQHALPGVYQGSPLFLPQVLQEPLPQWPDSTYTSERSTPDASSAPVTSPIDVSVLNIAPWMSSSTTHAAQPLGSSAWDGFDYGAVNDFANVFTNGSAFDETGESIQYTEGTAPDDGYQIPAVETSTNDGRFDAKSAPLQYTPTSVLNGTVEIPVGDSSTAGTRHPAVGAFKRNRDQQTSGGPEPAAKRCKCASKHKGINSQSRLKPLLNNEVQIVTRADKLARTKKAGTEKRKNVVEKERRDNGTHQLDKLYSTAVKISDEYQPPEGVTDNAVELTFLDLIDDRDAQAARADDATATIVSLKEENARLADQRVASMAEIQRLRAELNAVRDQAGGRTRTAHGELQGHDGLQAQFAA